MPSMVMLTPGRMTPLTSLVIPVTGVESTVSAGAFETGNIDTSKHTRMIDRSKGCSTIGSQFLVILLSFPGVLLLHDRTAFRFLSQ